MIKHNKKSCINENTFFAHSSRSQTVKDPYSVLSEQIMIKAFKDYKRVLISLRTYPDDLQLQSEKIILQHFFKSDWCLFLVNEEYNVDYIIERMEVVINGSC